ncbi:hypothetical protein B0H10DRAFT_2206452 [Mycena sp. CBHHK59/15]|nr:hypothetical protein B0H10DRAFT_2206452 [Mycena sp. CBHHK59/15]
MALDLLRNRDSSAGLGAFDGQVAAFAKIGMEHYFITTNTDYVPAVPSLQLPHALFLRADMRYGTDDPVLWPQQWTAHYSHLPVISKKGSRPELQIMWWDPSQEDFVVKSSVMRGLGRLHWKATSRFVPPINDLVVRCKELQRRSPIPLSPLFDGLILTVLMWIKQLQTLPTTYLKMVFAVTSLQRAFLELDALYNYMTIYKPCIENYLSASTVDPTVAQCVGAFTTVPAVAQQLWSARLPFWFLRPTYVFDTENILVVVPLQEPHFVNSDTPGDGAPPVVYSGNSTMEKIAAIHRAAVQTPWYRDPFETADTRSRSLSPPPTLIASTSVASTSVASTSRHQAPRETNKQQRFKPYPANGRPSARKPAQNPPKPQRDKFSLLSIPEMPPSIAAWSDALANVDRSVSPFTSDPAARRYVLPEPALLVNTTPKRRRKFLHHWTLLSDGFMYILSQPPHAQLLAAQEWRDVLEGLLTKRGHPDSKMFRRSAQLEDCIRPALVASGVESIEGFPVPLESLPEFSLERMREIVWEVAETNFRFEFCALDKRASKKERLDDVKTCFAGHMLIGVPLEMSKRGLAATTITERGRYLVRIANLMLDWTTQSPRPDPISRGVAQRANWNSSEMERLEVAVCRYYTQAFWEYFGRAAIVPMRLDHDLEKGYGKL